jgi:hypothetical protein
MIKESESPYVWRKSRGGGILHIGVEGSQIGLCRQVFFEALKAPDVYWDRLCKLCLEDAVRKGIFKL